MLSSSHSHWNLTTTSIVCHEKNILGNGESCTVFYGKWYKSIPIAIKYKKKSSTTRLPTVIGATDIPERDDEIAFLTTLHHPHIIRFYGYYVRCEDQCMNLVMEYLPYTLSSFLSFRERYTWCIKRWRWKYGGQRIKLRLMKDLFCGLLFLHERSIIHRDLKPHNLFLTYDGQLKIGDFGISERPCRSSSSSPSKKIGTYRYMAPEVYFERKYDERLDLWSVGMILYDLLYGSHSLPPYDIYTYYYQFSLEFQERYSTIPSIRTFSSTVVSSRGDGNHRRNTCLCLFFTKRNRVLHTLLKSCLHLDYVNRPSALQCFEFIHDNCILDDKDRI